jgi:chromosome segregation ATPase
VYRHDLEKEKKNIKKQKEEYELKLKGLGEKVNTLQTQLENTKTDLVYIHKEKKAMVTKKDELDREKSEIEKRVKV